MNKLKFLLLIMLSTFTIIPGLSQQAKEGDIKSWKNRTTYNEFLFNDFSQAFYYNNCCYLGVFGKNIHKISIRHDSVYQIDDEKYGLIGSSLINS